MNIVSSNINSQLLNQAISLDQIGLCRAETHVGDEITFTDDEGNSINGIVTAIYPHIFFMDNGRSFTWVQYLIGNPFLKHRLKRELDEVSERKFYDKQDSRDRNYIKSRSHFEDGTFSPKRNSGRSHRGKAYFRSTLSIDEIDKLRKVMKGI